MRIISGIALGMYASAFMAIHRWLGRPPADWLARRAALAILKMYSLRGGIDEGAIALFEGWGATGRATMESLLAGNQLSARYRLYAGLLLATV